MTKVSLSSFLIKRRICSVLLFSEFYPYLCLAMKHLKSRNRPPVDYSVDHDAYLGYFDSEISRMRPKINAWLVSFWKGTFEFWIKNFELIFENFGKFWSINLINSWSVYLFYFTDKVIFKSSEPFLGYPFIAN